MSVSAEFAEERVLVCPVARLAPGQSVSLSAFDDEIAVFFTGEAYFAMSNRCPHEGAPLSGCPIMKGTVLCPRHGWRIQLRHPEAGKVWADGLNRYAVQVLEEGIYVTRV